MGVGVGTEIERARMLAAFTLASTSSDDLRAVTTRASELLQRAFGVVRVAVVLRTASGDVVRGEALATVALTAPVKTALERSTEACIVPLHELSWAHEIVSATHRPPDRTMLVGWVPLHGDSEVRGFLFFSPDAQKRQRRTASAGDIGFLVAFTQHVRHALHGVRVAEGLRARADELAMTNLLLRQHLAEAEHPEAQPAPRAAEGTAATVLLVEDEDAIRALASRVLEGHGFRVLLASNGEEALAVARREGAVDLLLTDVVMPRISGVELAKALRRESLTRGVLFMSGRTHEVLDGDGSAERFLQKPFTPHRLVASVSECVATGTPAPPRVTH